jgi:hypothetical protein
MDSLAIAGEQALAADPSLVEQGVEALRILLSAGWPGVLLAFGILSFAGFGLWLKLGRRARSSDPPAE